MNKKIVFLPYDFDTALGIDNVGALVFGYGLEDTDHVAGGANVFAGQDSVLWNNVRKTFGNEIRTMYQNLRASGNFSYETVEQMFEDHQDKWPEAVFNEDAWFKYIAPLVDDNNATYLSMALGSKEEQRKWWLYNRFRYMDSKFNAGDALTKYIILRGFAKDDITITPYADIYPAVRFGSYLVKERGARNTATVIENPLPYMENTDTYIYSADQLASVGDLSGLKVGFADFSMATKLQQIKVGNSDDEYENPNLTELYVGNNLLLNTVDVRNCTHLAQAVDLSGCANIEYVYFDGTAITGCSLPNGGIVKVLHLPDTLTNLTIRNQTMITDFTMDGYSNITTLRLENVSSVIDTQEIFESLPASSRVRLIGVNWSVDSVTDAIALYNTIDTMRGLDENGNNLENAVISGTLFVPTLSGSQLASLRERQPNITITYEHIQSTLRYFDWEGNNLLYSETVSDNGSGTYTGQPTHADTAQYTFTFAGWSTSKNASAAEPGAISNLSADRDVYAAYTLTIRTYTVTWQNSNGTVLETDTNVPYGGSATYNGSQPVHPSDPTDMQFTGFSPDGTNITGNTTCVAQYRSTAIPLLKYLNGTMTEYESDEIETIGMYAFGNMTTLIRAETSATLIESYAFDSCSNLEEYEAISTNSVTIQSDAFSSCTKFKSLILRSTTVSTLAASNILGFKFIGGDGAIYVPANLVESYKSATNWSTYASHIVSIDDYPVTNFDTITDSWSDIVTASSNGSYDSKYSVGDIKTITVGNNSVEMQLVAKDVDTLSAGGTAHMTWLCKNFYTTHRMNASSVTTGGWASSEMKSWLISDILPNLPTEVQNGIKEVNKTYYDYGTTSTAISQDKIWIPSYREVGYGTDKEDSGPIYSLFSTSASRIKYNTTTGSAGGWWLRSASSSSSFYFVTGNGSSGNYYANKASGVVFGFCI